MHSRVNHIVFVPCRAQAKSILCVKISPCVREKWVASHEVWILSKYKELIINSDYSNLVPNTSLSYFWRLVFSLNVNSISIFLLNYLKLQVELYLKKIFRNPLVYRLYLEPDSFRVKFQLFWKYMNTIYNKTVLQVMYVKGYAFGGLNLWFCYFKN